MPSNSSHTAAPISCPETAPSWWQRRWRFRLAALLLTLLALLGTDRALHAAWYWQTYDDFGVPQQLSKVKHVKKGFLRFVPDPWLGDRYRANLRLNLRSFNMLTGSWGSYTLQTNSLGFRGPEVVMPKPSGTLRVVAMGGSSTMGQGVDETSAYPAQLATLLARRFADRRVEVVNAGVQGYASKHGYKQYARDIIRLQPDLLIVAYDVNDGYMPMNVQQVAAWKPPSPPPSPPPLDRMPLDQGKTVRGLGPQHAPHTLTSRLHHSGLYLTARYLHAWIKLTASWHQGQQHNGYSGPLPTPGGPRLRCPKARVFAAVGRPWDPNILWYQGNLVALDRLAVRDRVPVVYLSVPLEGFADLQPAYPYSAVMARLAAGRPDRRHVSPAAQFCRYYLDEVMIDYCHPSDRGHAMIARALEPAVTALLRRKAR